MQFPIGAKFNAATMRMEVTDFQAVLFNPVAQDKFVHTVAAGYVTGSIFVLAISAYYLLRRRHVDLAKRSMTVAASFGLTAALCVVVLGDESGYTATANQRMKIAAIEAMWDTEPAPASFTLVGFPDVKNRRNEFAVRIPWVLGLITTRSLDKQVPGIDDLVALAQKQIRSGMVAYDALDKLRADRGNAQLQHTLDAHVDDLGYALLLKRERPDVQNATPEQIARAAQSTIPNVPVLFWSFRIMVGLGFLFIALFALSFYLAAKRHLDRYPLYLRAAMFSLPLPWIAAELGWIVSEYGRQPWAIEGVLPTFLGVSGTSSGDVWFSLGGFVLFYSALAVADVYLMIKYIRLGPDAAIGHAVAPAGARVPAMAE
jgi:cytochrome d ubiquinol oxidase subunit I